MVVYRIINKTDNYSDLGLKCKTFKEAKQKLKEIKEFDKRHGNPFNDEYIIRRERYI